MAYLHLSEWPEVSRDPKDIDKLAGKSPIGLDLEWDAKGSPHLIGLSDGTTHISVPYHEGKNRFLSILRKFPTTTLVGHNIVGADLFVLESAGIKLPLDQIEDTIIRHWLVNMHLSKSSGKAALEEDADEKRGRGFNNLWTMSSLYTNFPHWKTCRDEMKMKPGKGVPKAKTCTGPCPLHDEPGYNGLDAAAPVIALPHLRRTMLLRGIEKLYPMHRELAWRLSQIREFGVRVDVPYVEQLRTEFDRDKLEIAQTLPFNPDSEKQVREYFKSKHDLVLDNNQEQTIRDMVEELGEDEAPDELVQLQEYKELGNGPDRWFKPQYLDKHGYVKGFVDEHGYVHPHLAFFCADQETECLTSSGWKTHNQLIPGELIAAFDPATEKLSWQSLEEVNRFDVVEEPLVRIDSRNLDIFVTPEHKSVIRRPSGAIQIKEAQDIRQDDAIPCAAEWEESSESYFVDVTPALAELIGWYVADGHEGQSGHMIYVYQSRTANLEKANRIEFLLKALDSDYSRVDYNKKDYAGRDYIYSAFQVRGYIALRLRELCPSKKLPLDILQWPKSLLGLVSEGLLGGDGYVSKDKRDFGQKDRATADQFQAITLRLGLPATIHGPNGRGQNHVYVTKKKWHQPRGAKWSAKSPYEMVPYTGVVWCPTVKTGFWLARRGGHPFITGNTSSARLMCSSPNLQNVAKRRKSRKMCECGHVKAEHGSEGCRVLGCHGKVGHKFSGESIGKKVRRAIIAPDGYYIVRADLSNAENRVVLYLSGYQIDRETDLHEWVKEMAGLTDDMEFAQALGNAREAAKSIQHAGNILEGLQLKTRNELHAPRLQAEVKAGARVVYPEWTFRGKVVTFTGVNLARRAFGDASLPNRKKALDIANKYFDKFPGVRDFQKRVSKQVETEGVVRPPNGYVLLSYGQDVDQMKIAQGTFQQQPVAHITKLAILNAMNRWDRDKLQRPVLQVHDELLCYVKNSVAPEQAMAWLREDMEVTQEDMPGFVIPAEASYGNSWRDQKKG